LKDVILKYFDEFFLKARLMPVAVLSLPIILMAICKGIISDDIVSVIRIGFVAFLIAIVLFAHIVREIGKRYEARMYKALGAKPTTIVMRFSDDRIGEFSKERYHKIINDLDIGVRLPVTADEETRDNLSDDKYNSVIDYLRTYANANQNQMSRVRQELIKYNFWRNIYGGKWIALVVYGLLAVREICKIDGFSIVKMCLEPYPVYVSLIVFLVSVLILCLTVTRKTVERNAFNYAVTLVESVDIINEVTKADGKA
jgi:hypothetical protein